ncbi:hypothetical protein ACFE04_002535 [Oxalis oulophora]
MDKAIDLSLMSLMKHGIVDEGLKSCRVEHYYCKASSRLVFVERVAAINHSIMPAELPGYYFDVEKNRYFPIKGPIPGGARSSSSSSSAPKPPTKPIQQNNLFKRKGLVRTSKLLHARELNGNFIASSKGKSNFTEEFQKRLASKPTAWKYKGGDPVNSALGQLNISLQTPEGQKDMDIMLTGSTNGILSYFEVGKVWPDFDYGLKSIPDCVWPISNEHKAGSIEGPGYTWRATEPLFQLRSEENRVTTLGSEISGGSVYILKSAEPVDSDNSVPSFWRRSKLVASFQCTIWTADHRHGTDQAVIGTNRGAAIVNLETGVPSWVCRSKSDVMSIQADHSGKVILCGLRNGAIVTIDVRENHTNLFRRLIPHQIPYSDSGQTGRNSKQWFEVKGNVVPSHTIHMPPSVSCLVALELHDQYFLASSVDGSKPYWFLVVAMCTSSWEVKLYDHRFCQRGAVQTYEGNVNTHTRIQLGVDPFERFVMSGGEDCKLRLWSIKSGELLFNEKFSDSILSTVYWERTADNGHWKAWMGSQEGLYCMHW